MHDDKQGAAHQGDAPTAAGRTEPEIVVHIIHGTWADPRRAKARPMWSEPGGSLEQALRARLSPEANERTKFRSFIWSGKNRFSARTEAMNELRVYLNDALQENPGARHLLLAHSHGGTVAAGALHRMGAEAQRIGGLLTMGTPFVERMVAYRDRDSLPFDGFTGAFAPLIGAAMGLAAALAFAIAGQLVAAGLLAVWTLTPIGLLAARKWSMAASIASSVLVVAAPLAATRSAQVFSSFFALTFLTGFLAVVLAGKLPALHPATRLANEESIPEAPPVPLIALRLPGDEAGLAIAASQFAVWMDSKIRSVVASMGGALLSLPGRYLWPILLALGAAGTWIHDLWYGITRTSVWEWLLAWAAATLLGSLIVLWGGVVLATILKFAAACLLALACGPEVFESPGYTKVYAETLPRLRPMKPDHFRVRVLFPSPEDLKSLAPKNSLRHSMYEYPSVQEAVADWIESHLLRKAEPAG
jgi:hypothetical protein